MQLTLTTSSTKSLTLLCCLAASAQVTEGFVSTTTRTTSNSPHSPLSTTTTTTAVPSSSSSLYAISSTMLSSAASSATTAAASATATSTAFFNPRRRLDPATPPFAATKSRRTSSSSSALDFAVGRVPVGGSSTAVRSTALPSSSFAPSPLFSSASGQAPDCPFTAFMASFGAVWGSLGVIYVLAKGVSRALPFALEPLYESSSLVLSPLQWSMYALSCIFFAYAEGYKGFHTRFAPLVVKRSFTLVVGTPQGNNPLNYFLAPLYSMGLWGATKKRLTVSWALNLGIVAIVAVVKKLPPAPRCIIDAGVVLGLTIGSASILYHFLVSLWTGRLPVVDACLPAAAARRNAE